MKKKSFVKKVLISIFLIGFAALGVALYEVYKSVYISNVTLNENDSVYFYIQTASTLETIANQLEKKGIIQNKNTFIWVAEKKNYKKHIYPGRYLIKNGLNNNDLVNLLRSGKQAPVKLLLNHCVRKKENFVSLISSELETDSAELIQLLNDDAYLSKYNLISENAMALFIANTYEFYWNTSADKFMERMGKEYLKFWTEERLQKAAEIGLAPSQIIALASIVQSETGKDSDRPIIAGVYINRLHKNMPLQADPTLVWAVGNFSTETVLNLNAYKDMNSPYNTYKFTGIPPGPICLVDKKNIDAVLSYQKHNYLYFCAKEDFSGYSNFAESFDQHQLNAKRYQKALREKLKK